MSPDTNSSIQDSIGYFNFSITGGIKGVTYTFHVCNFTEGHQESVERTRPCILSSRSWKRDQVSWHRTREFVAFRKNERHPEVRQYSFQIFEPKIKDRYLKYSTLTFKVTVKHKKDKVFLCSTLPYTYTDLQKDFRHFQNLSTIYSSSRL